jgi:PTH1 family peptidyl-tRNA hydrolase
MKYLIVGLGNIGDGYRDTRHNIGFKILDAMALASNISFTDKRYGAVASTKYKGRELILLKPSTYMNLSGNAVNYWMKKENIPLEKILIILDDIALPLGSIRLRSKGSDGGHNGLAHITAILGTHDYPRIRFGIGNGFRRGSQVDFVLGTWSMEENKVVGEKIPVVIEMIRSFAFAGVELTMTAFNKAGKIKPAEKKKDSPGENPS